MQHFHFLSDDERAHLFCHPPQLIDRQGPRASVALSLGATLYSPGTRSTLAADSRRIAAIGGTSHVWCLEDSIADQDVAAAFANVVEQFRELQLDPLDSLPMIFVRVRAPEQVTSLAAQVRNPALTGFVLPKLDPSSNSQEYLRAVETASETTQRRLYAMPVLEHQHLAWSETRKEFLGAISGDFDKFGEHILALRVGGTDLCGLFGLRRDSETTIWDVAVVREVLTDVLNTFTRNGDYTVCGPVWEHFRAPERLMRPQLRMTPFAEGGRLELRNRLLETATDELIREVMLDRANGFLGKTVIHPSHIAIVNALYAVSEEEYDDALEIARAGVQSGARASTAGNKMNEARPHALWARQTIARGEVFGVLRSPGAVVDLMEAGGQAYLEHFASA